MLYRKGKSRDCPFRLSINSVPSTIVEPSALPQRSSQYSTERRTVMERCTGATGGKKGDPALGLQILGSDEVMIG